MEEIMASAREITSARPLAVVTGASSGIGRELARQFVEGGFDVLIAAEDCVIADAAQDLNGRGRRRHGGPRGPGDF
jgi:NAD(P)-dependent dehydrogenase (short-subunit alcohol dehydrogenase family)